jgi:DNA polymerase-1
MSRHLLVVDGTNLIMRAAFGGDIPADRAVPTAMSMLARAILEVRPTHVVHAFDSPLGPSWRRAEYPLYKANRTTDTAPYILAFAAALEDRGHFTLWSTGFEADDIVATLVSRVAYAVPLMRITILSNDSDLLACTTPDVSVLRPVSGAAGFETLTMRDACLKYGVAAPERIHDWKALVGETGDNVPGVPGIGPKKASQLLAAFDGLEAIIGAGHACASKEARRVYEHREQARQALRLVTLRTDAPVPPIQPARCALARTSPSTSSTAAVAMGGAA